MKPILSARLPAIAALAALPTAAFSQDAAQAVGAGVGLVIGLLIAIVVGAVVGWIASLIVGGSGGSFWVDVLVGIGGSLIASYLFPAIGIPLGGGAIGAFIAAVIGAVILLLIIRLVRRA
ncbi:GlsB/YeaQ/YmgE family stress response membrane protein [Rhodobacterales bacterium HKCCE3408]|nr:GlsB/YeaQ/YmgE family stress response membrane protein [Rhodobacterales bacterium HKCCE3408]